MIKLIQDMTPEEVINLPLLGLDDTFPFDCKACGKCCKNRTDLLLTGWDLFRIARYLGRTPEEVLDRYCEVYSGHESKLPVVRVKPRAYDESCPFLRNKKCIVHEAKPVACRVYPLAKLNKLGGEYGFYLNALPKCGKDRGVSVVQDWIGDIALEESIAAANAWTDAIFKIVPVLKKIYEEKSQDAYHIAYYSVFSFLYLVYETELDFAEQCCRNVNIFIENVNGNAKLK